MAKSFQESKVVQQKAIPMIYPVGNYFAHEFAILCPHKETCVMFVVNIGFMSLSSPLNAASWHVCDHLSA